MSASADPNPLLALFGAGHTGVLVTLKRDGRPQLSNVTHAFDERTRTVRISVTADRAKTKNLVRDARASYHVTSSDFWRYAVGEGLAELSPVASDPHDATVDELVALYSSVAGEHDDWAAYRTAMVTDRRLVVSLRLDHVYGQAG